MENNHFKLYADVEDYLIAFSYRDIPSECKFIREVFSKINNCDFSSCLELACGPAEHSFYFLNEGKRIGVLDLSQEMIDYIEERDKDHLAAKYQSDMQNFVVNEKYDLAINMLDSFAYLVNDDDIIQHFNCVADSLNKDGIYIIDMCHQKSWFCGNLSSECQGNLWRIEKDNKIVDTEWASQGTTYNYSTQIADINISMTIYNKASNTYYTIHDKARQRMFTANELRLLIKLSGRFELLEQYNNFDFGEPFSDSNDPYRMISVLRKVN